MTVSSAPSLFPTALGLWSRTDATVRRVIEGDRGLWPALLAAQVLVGPVGWLGVTLVEDTLPRIASVGAAFVAVLAILEAALIGGVLLARRVTGSAARPRELIVAVAWGHLPDLLVAIPLVALEPFLTPVSPLDPALRIGLGTGTLLLLLLNGLVSWFPLLSSVLSAGGWADRGGFVGLALPLGIVLYAMLRSAVWIQAFLAAGYAG